MSILGIFLLVFLVYTLKKKKKQLEKTKQKIIKLKLTRDLYNIIT